MNVNRYFGRAKSLLNRFGIDVRSSKHIFSNRFVQHVKRKNIRLVLDVGANKGQFAESIFACGYDGLLVSVEPLPDACEILVNKSTAHGKNWIIAPPMALSDEKGESEFNCFSASAMSSLLQPVANIQAEVPSSGVKDKISVRLETLTKQFWEEVDVELQDFALKIDTQGSELSVLRGAHELMNKIKMVQVECSANPYYDGQPHYFELDEYLRSCGFKLVDLSPGYRNPNTDRLLEFDAIYEMNE